jgi:hypothetical protein
MTNNKSKGFGGGSLQTIPSELMEILQNNSGLSVSDIRRSLHYKYCKRTVQKYLYELKAEKKVECYVNGSMREPLYRVVK